MYAPKNGKNQRRIADDPQNGGDHLHLDQPADDPQHQAGGDEKQGQHIGAVAAVHQAGKFFFQFIHFVLVSPFSKYMPILYPF